MDINSLNIKYPTINDVDEKWGLVVTTVGFQIVLPKEPYPTKGHPKSHNFNPISGRILHEYQLLYFTKGNGTFTSKHCKETKIEAGMILLLFPFEWHTYVPNPNTGWDQYWIGFNGKLADDLVSNNFFNKKTPILNIGFLEQLVDLYKRAIEVAKQEKNSFQQYISSIAMEMLGLVYFTLQNNLFIDEDVVNKIDQARLLMREYPARDRSPEEIASELNMSYSWFRKMFKKYTGLSPTQYQLQIKVKRAKEYLVSSFMPIKERSDILHFESVNYFISFFKEKTSESPSEFRNRTHGSPKK